MKQSNQNNTKASELQPFKFGDKELDEMHGLNQYDFVARQLSSVLPVFTTRDPLSEKYYNISSYAYCLNNPMRYVDPDGRDVWEINAMGEIVDRKKDKTEDAFYMVNEDGNRIEGKELAFEYGTITDAKKSGWFRDATSFSVISEAAGADLFKFFADNTKIEFGLINTKNNGSTVMTNHKESSVKVSSTTQKLSDKGQTVTSVIHNHPNNSQPSGFRVGDKSGDKFAARILPNVDRYVYQPGKNALVMYDNQSIIQGIISWKLFFSPITETAPRLPNVPARRFYSGKLLPH